MINRISKLTTPETTHADGIDWEVEFDPEKPRLNGVELTKLEALFSDKYSWPAIYQMISEGHFSMLLAFCWILRRRVVPTLAYQAFLEDLVDPVGQLLIDTDIYGVKDQADTADTLAGLDDAPKVAPSDPVSEPEPKPLHALPA